ncbi:hypothetical protein TWF730_007092 [Orbilia blumenaviensis]|uniref:DRBM domain-containing protein n=1 Tax=Orbilia blumenaviensis TaxID=1796055 RepID=A0AAV9VHN5_9PEZI
MTSSPTVPTATTSRSGSARAPQTRFFTSNGKKLEGNIYYPDAEKYKFDFSEAGGLSGLVNFRVALLVPGRPTMRGNTFQRAQNGIRAISAFVADEVRQHLSRRQLPRAHIREAVDRLSTRSQIAAFAKCFDFTGLVGVDVGTVDLPLDVGEIMGLLHTAGLYGHRDQIETGLRLVVRAAVWETVLDSADSQEAVPGSRTVDRTRPDIPAGVARACPELTAFVRANGLAVTSTETSVGKEGDGSWEELVIRSIGFGHRNWKVRGSGRNLHAARVEAGRAALEALEQAFSCPGIF